MKIVVDSNRIIAALMKESTTRKILFSDVFDFIAPDFIEEEVEKYKPYIIKKAKITKEEFNLLSDLIFENIEIISKDKYPEFISEAKLRIKDEKDITYVALYLAYDAKGIWTHDRHFSKLKNVRILSNIDMLGLMKATGL